MDYSCNPCKQLFKKKLYSSVSSEVDKITISELACVLNKSVPIQGTLLPAVSYIYLMKNIIFYKYYFCAY